MPRVHLGALGWVNESPAGNRLRWSVPVQAVVDGRHLGLPVSTVIERAMIPATVSSDIFPSGAPSGAIPLAWWKPQGTLPIPAGTLTRVPLESTLQAIRFTYAGPRTLVRVLGPDDRVLQTREVDNFDLLLFEDTEIVALEFLLGGGEMQAVMLLDLFAGHDTGVDYETIAILAPRSTPDLPLAVAEQRLAAPSGLDAEEWAAYQAEVALARATPPDAIPVDDSGISLWDELTILMSVRWRLSVLFGFGFLDGPDAGPGAPPDRIEGPLLQALPTRAHLYRVRCSFEDHPEIVSNPYPVQPMLASPLQAPQPPHYERAEVRLFGEADYEMTARIGLVAPDPRTIGADLEEALGQSSILGTAATLDSFTFQSWRAPDWHGRMVLERAATLPFYDLPMRLRARSLDGWDRVSPWSGWSPQTLPKFIHSPAAPPLADAEIAGPDTRLYPRTPTNRFTEWTPDHAARNTPGSVLAVMRRTADPATVSIGISAPVFEAADGTMDRFRAIFTGNLSQPGRFAGGAVIAPGFRASILQIDGASVIFRPYGDGADTAAMPGPGEVTLQQNPAHPALFSPVASYPVSDLPGVVAFADVLPAPAEVAQIAHYAVRVEMGVATGALSNTVAAIRQPEAPATPPPFAIEILGVDFYDRTMVRLRFLAPTTGAHAISWAEGAHEAADFHQVAIHGDYGQQTPWNGHELFEVFSLPVPSALPRTVTFGVQAERAGGQVSPYAVLSLELPIYEA